MLGQINCSWCSQTWAWDCINNPDQKKTKTAVDKQSTSLVQCMSWQREVNMFYWFSLFNNMQQMWRKGMGTPAFMMALLVKNEWQGTNESCDLYWRVRGQSGIVSAIFKMMWVWDLGYGPPKFQKKWVNSCFVMKTNLLCRFGFNRGVDVSCVCILNQKWSQIPPSGFHQKLSISFNAKKMSDHMLHATHSYATGFGTASEACRSLPPRK